MRTTFRLVFASSSQRQLEVSHTTLRRGFAWPEKSTSAPRLVSSTACLTKERPSSSSEEADGRSFEFKSDNVATKASPWQPSALEAKDDEEGEEEHAAGNGFRSR